MSHQPVAFFYRVLIAFLAIGLVNHSVAQRAPDLTGPVELINPTVQFGQPLQPAFAHEVGSVPADILWVIDTSVSMGDDIAEVKARILDFNTAMIANGINANYGLVRFGGDELLIQDVVGFETFTAAESPFSTLIANNGNPESGSAAVAVGLNEANFRQNSVINIILVTDEDDDSTTGEFSAAIEALEEKGALFNFIGVPGVGTTDTRYGFLAENFGGQAFEISEFRANPAPFFTNFIDTKVQEIVTAAECDVDVDGDIDSIDIQLIVTARNTPAESAADPRDPDRNGSINVLDARICVLRCSNTNCAVADPNIPPVANAGLDETITWGETAALDGSASTDENNVALSYEWLSLVVPVGSVAELSNPTSVSPSITPDLPGSYTFQLVVNDGVFDSDPDLVVIVVEPVLVPDVVGLSQVEAEAQIISSGLATGTITFENSLTVPVDQVISQDPAANAGVILGHRIDLVISFGPLNVAPQVTSTPVTAALTMQAYVYDVDATDADSGDVLTFSLDVAPVGMTIDAMTGLIDWLPSLSQVGPNSVTVRVADDAGLFDTQSFVIIVAVGNQAPTIISTPVANAIVGELYTYDVDATDPNPGDTLTFSLDVAPTGMSIDSSTGQISWTPTVPQTGANAVTVRVQDTGGLVATQSFVVEATAANRPPTIISSPPSAAQVGSIYIYAVGATDPDAGDTLIFSLDVAPAGMTIDTANGVVTWTPVANQTGSNPVTMRVTDLAGLFATQAYFINVTSGGDFTRPEVSLTVNDNVVLVGAIVTATVSTTDDVGVVSIGATADGTPITLSASNQGTFTRTTPGIVVVSATATDAAGNTGDAALEVRFLAGTGGTPPTVSIASPSDGARIEGPVDVVGTATDTDFVRYVLELADSNTGDFFEIGNGDAAVVNGVLGQVDSTQLRNGSYDLRLTAEDANGNSASTMLNVQLEGENSVGNFTLAFEDLVLPVAGIDISITRVYDSRVKTSGDFGVGWKLVLNDFKIQENTLPGEGWTQTVTGGFFPTYSVVAARPHSVRVTAPDGEISDFSFEVTSGGSVLIPYSLTVPVNVAYFDASGSGAQLEALGVSSSLPVLGSATGPVTLLEDFQLNVYDPVRYRFTSDDGTQVVLNQNSGIESISDPNGNTITFGSSGLIHSAGKSVTFTRDSQGRITKITDPMGNTLSYEYDFYGDLVAVTDQEGNISRMIYNSNHGLVDFFDPRGVRPSRTEYAADGRVEAIIDAEGNRMEFTHDITGQIEVIRDRRGNTTVYEYDDRGNIVSETNPLGYFELRSFDADGNLLNKTDALGNVSSFTYDSRGNRLTNTDALGNMTQATFNEFSQPLTETDARGNVTTFGYDSAGNQNLIRDALGNEMSNTFDASGNRLSTTDQEGDTLSYTYNANGDIATYSDFTGTLTSYTYDANGNRLTESIDWTDGTGTAQIVTTQFEYDGLNRIIREVDPLGYVKLTEYNSIGEISATVDKNGNRTEFEYDARKNMVRVTYADATEETATFDAEKNRTSRTDRNGNTTVHEYDAANRPIRTVYSDGTEEVLEYDGAGQRVAKVNSRGNRTEFAYDAAGRQISMTDPFGNVTTQTYDAHGNKASITDALGRTTLYEYDVLNRLIGATHPDGSTTTKTYDARGQVDSETDQAGNTSTYAYDVLRRLVSITDALDGLTTFTYDKLSNRTSQTDAEGRVTTWEYDALGQLLRRAMPNGQVESFVYDAQGNLVGQTDFNGDMTVFEYDNNNRRIRATYANGDVVSYTWLATGRVTSVTDAGGVVNHLYDVRDRLLRTDFPDGTFLEYAYDAAGNRSLVRTPAGATMHEFDALNRMTRITDSNGGVSLHSYDAVGNRRLLEHANGNLAIATFDDLNRLNVLSNERSDGSVISAYTYTLDAIGNRTSVTEDTGRVVTYTYDALHRLLTEVETGRSIAHTYDAVGNRLTENVNGVVTSLSYDNNDRLLSEGTIAYDYDANGNLISKTDGADITSYTFDLRNRLSAVTEGGQTITYGYDDAGILVRSTSGGVTTSYLVDKNVDDTRFEVSRVLEARQGGALVASYTYGDDLLNQTRAATTSYFQYDGLGSTRALTDNSEATTDTYIFDAFGAMLSSTGSTANDYLYAGEQVDPNTGFYYLRARWYQPDVGRFLSMDTFSGVARDPITLHKYLYANANPVNMIDPTGYFGMVGAMGGMGIRISLPVINYGLLLARVALVARTVATAAVATCAASQAISTFTALNGPVPGCNSKGATVFFTGLDTPLTTAHIATAMLGHAGPLNRIQPKNPRGWLRSDPRCKGNVAGLTGSWCDEYPFASTRQGGQANAASLRLVPSWEQILQGVKLGGFYIACNIVPNDPVKGLFAVSFAPVTAWSCGP